MKYGFDLMTEEEAQQMVYQYLKRFGYNPIQAFPKAAFRGDGQGTLLFRLFEPEKIMSHVYYVEDEGVRHPLAIRTVATKAGRILLYMGLVSMRDKMKHKPEKNSMDTSGRKGGMTESGLLMGKPFFSQIQELTRMLKLPAIQFTVNPANRNQPVPVGYNLSADEDMTGETQSKWLRANYPELYKNGEFRRKEQQILDNLQWTPKKDEAYRKILEYSKGINFSKFMYENEPESFNKYIHVANAVNPKVAQSLEALGLVRYNDHNISDQSELFGYLKEILDTVEEKKRKGVYIKMPTQIKKWMSVLKIFDTFEEDEDEDDVDPDDRITRINPKWQRVMRGTGGRKQPAKEYYKRQMKVNPDTDPCCDELKENLYRLIIIEAGDYLGLSDYDIKKKIEDLTCDQLSRSMEASSFEVAEVEIKPKKLLDERTKRQLQINEPTLYENHQNCKRQIAAFTEDTKEDAKPIGAGNIPDPEEMSRNERLRERFRDYREQVEGKKVERFGFETEEDDL